MVHILSRAKSAFLSMTTVFILEQMESVFKDKSDKVIPTFILLIIYCGHAYLRISFTALQCMRLALKVGFYFNFSKEAKLFVCLFLWQYRKEIDQQSFRCKKIIYLGKNALFKSFFFTKWSSNLCCVLWSLFCVCPWQLIWSLKENIRGFKAEITFKLFCQQIILYSLATHQST